MTQGILVINAGSSSIKFSAYAVAEGNGTLELRMNGLVEGIGGKAQARAKRGDGSLIDERTWQEGEPNDFQSCFAELVNWLTPQLEGMALVGVGHRVVHGGPELDRPVLLDPKTVEALEALVPLAPLHQPSNLLGVKTSLKLKPDIPNVACFDTAFHRTQPRVADAYGLPAVYYDSGVRRYGFHGLSYEYIATRLPELAPELADGRVVVAHLGSGSSMCALQAGKSVATTMGFSPLDGLPMGTRCGGIDPGVLLYLMDKEGMDSKAISNMLYKRSGLLGMSGISNDMRELKQSDDPNAAQAVDYFLYRIGRELGSLAAALGGLDGLVFTAGIGENDVDLRERVCKDAAWLGVELDVDANRYGEVKISTPESAVSVWAIPTNEELMIAKHTHDLIAA